MGNRINAAVSAYFSDHNYLPAASFWQGERSFLQLLRRDIRIFSINPLKIALILHILYYLARPSISTNDFANFLGSNDAILCQNVEEISFCCQGQ
jgi:hypothetical protein